MGLSVVIFLIIIYTIFLFFFKSKFVAIHISLQVGLVQGSGVGWPKINVVQAYLYFNIEK